MTNEQRGKYIMLLCLQHQKGKLTLKDLQAYLTDEDYEIAEKFPISDDGFYYNIRMKEEAEKRKSYSESRSKNRKSKKQESNISDTKNNIYQTYLKHMNNTSTSYVKHMENENEDVNVNNNSDINDNTNKTNKSIILKLLDELHKADTIEKADPVVADLYDIGWDYIYDIMQYSEEQKEKLKSLVKQRLGLF
jgi:hypothetical protein